MDIFEQYLLFVFLTSIGMGIFAQMGKFCLFGGINAWLYKKNIYRVWVYLVAISVAVIGVGMLEYMELVDLDTTSPPYRSETFSYGRYIIGGFIFGFGMVLASGCGMRHLVKLGQGSLNALLVILVMAVSVYAMLKTSLYADIFMPILTPLSFNFSDLGNGEIGYQDLATIFVGNSDSKSIVRLALSLMVAFPILFFAFKNKDFRQPRYSLSAIGVGAAIVLGFYISGGEFGQLLIEEADFMDDIPRGLATQSYSFAAPLSDVIYAAMYQEGWSVITFGVVAVIGLPVGALISSLARKEFQFTGITNAKGLAINLLGAVLAGVGSVLAMGCSVGHGLTGISTLALGSFVALSFIVLGALTGIQFLSTKNQ